MEKKTNTTKAQKAKKPFNPKGIIAIAFVVVLVAVLFGGNFRVAVRDEDSIYFKNRVVVMDNGALGTVYEELTGYDNLVYRTEDGFEVLDKSETAPEEYELLGEVRTVIPALGSVLSFIAKDVVYAIFLIAFLLLLSCLVYVGRGTILVAVLVLLLVFGGTYCKAVTDNVTFFNSRVLTVKNGSLAVINEKLTNYDTIAYELEKETETGYETVVETAPSSKLDVLPEGAVVIGEIRSYIPVIGRVLSVLSNEIVLSVLIIAYVTSMTLFAYFGKKRKGVKQQLAKRLSIQTIWAIVTNSYAIGYIKGTIYQGPLKHICVPGMNCYSCPGAMGACPIGALQAIIGKRSHTVNEAGELVSVPTNYVPFYIIGFLMIVGAICGRFVCGFLCPFGWIQELLHKIPLPKKMKKINTFKGDKALRYLKYVVLAVFVFIMPLFSEALGLGVFPWFCKLICPSGMSIGGLPLMSLNAGLRGAAGSFTVLKLCILAVIVLASIVIYRPFCKYLCPLGAMYSFLNPVSMYKVVVDNDKCNNCGACAKVCKMNVDIRKHPNSLECIRCGDCKAACPQNAISTGMFKKLPARIKPEEMVVDK